MTKWLGWHFADKTETLRYGDGRKITVGKTHSVQGKLVMCEYGLHASHTVFDALAYAPGPILFRVELSGEILHGEDKSVASRRKYLARLDATGILREYARWCALQVVHLWDCPPVVREWLEMGNPALQSAAWSAAESATRSATRDATWSAAWSAAESAIEDAVERAAKFSARDAAWSATWSATRKAQKEMLEQMVRKAMVRKAMGITE